MSILFHRNEQATQVSASLTSSCPLSPTSNRTLPGGRLGNLFIFFTALLLAKGTRIGRGDEKQALEVLNNVFVNGEVLMQITARYTCFSIHGRRSSSCISMFELSAKASTLTAPQRRTNIKIIRNRGKHEILIKCLLLCFSQRTHHTKKTNILKCNPSGKVETALHVL